MVNFQIALTNVGLFSFVGVSVSVLCFLSISSSGWLRKIVLVLLDGDSCLCLYIRSKVEKLLLNHRYSRVKNKALPASNLF
jgi:hypothetical protein